MAGRKPRLFDTVNKLWIDFKDLNEADSLFKDKERNPFVTTKEYGVTSRYRYDEPMDNMELLQISLGGKPKNPNSTAARAYKLLNPDENLDKRTSGVSVGVNPILDRDYNFVKHPELKPTDKPIFYKDLDEYWGYNSDGEYTNKIPENNVGSAARRKLLAESKDPIEERDKWISEYFTFLDGGVESMSPEALEAYAQSYANGNARMLANNPKFNPNDPYVVKSRALTDLGGKSALKSMLEDLKIERNTETEGLYLLAELSNIDLAKLSEQNPLISKVFDNLIELCMLKYYGNVANKYIDDPTNIDEDIRKHGKYAKMNNLIEEGVLEESKDSNKLRRVGWTALSALASLGNYMVNNAGTQLLNTFGSDTIVNHLRDRANDMVNLISDRITQKELELEKTQDEISKDLRDFDKLASATYEYYRLNDLSTKLPTEKKQELLGKYKVQANTVGLEIADKNLIKELQNFDYDSQSTIKRLGYTFNNTVNTIGTTLGHIANMGWYIPLAAFDVLLSGYEAAANSKPEDFLGNWWDNLGNELYDTWQRSLDNPLVNYLSDVESTGTWNAWIDTNNSWGLLKSLDLYKKQGINANKVLRRYGEDTKLWTPSTLFDVVPVTGYMMGAAAGTKGVNIMSNVLRGVTNLNKVGAVDAALKAGLAEGETASKMWNAASKGLELSHKFVSKPLIGKGATFMDATAPALSTAGMDFGYAKNNYDEGLLKALRYVESPEFEKLVNDRINYEQLGTPIEGSSTINSTIDDKVFFGLQNADFKALAEDLAKQHNSEISDIEDPWTVEDAAKELILKPYKDEYLAEAKKIATFNAGVTFGLTILPDIHITNTWRKSMFSSQSRGAMNRVNKAIGKVLGIKPKQAESYILGIKKVNGKWTINGKPMTRKDLFNMYVEQSVGGFMSNYLQDIGVAAGQGLLEEMLNQYIDLRFGDDTVDSISYDIDRAIISSAERAGLAFGEATSFRDGLYGAIAPWILSPARNIRDIATEIGRAKRKGTGAFIKSLIEEPILKNSLLYNVTFGAKDILNKENMRREAARLAVESWMNSNGKPFVDNIGGLLDLASKEKAAISNDDYVAFLQSKLGQMVLGAVMLALILNFLPIKLTIMEYMKHRAARKKVTLEDIDRLAEETTTIAALLKLAEAELAENASKNQDLLNTKALEALLAELDKISQEDKSIINDLILIREYHRDTETKDTRTEVELLNELLKSSKQILSLIDKYNKYQLDAEAILGESADIVLKQEYARLLMYQDLLKQDIEDKTELLDKIEKGIMFTPKEAEVNSTVPLDDKHATFISEFGGDRQKVKSRLEDLKTLIESLEARIRECEIEIKSKLKAKKKAGTDEQAAAYEKEIQTEKSFKTFLEQTRNMAMLERSHLKSLLKDYDNSVKELESVPTPVIAAKDILNLSLQARLKLLKSKKLSKEQLKEVDKFNAGVWFSNDIEDTNVTSYVDLLESKIHNESILKRLSYEGKLTPEAILRISTYALEKRKEQNRRVYAKQYESFADESLYHTNKVPNVNPQQTVDEATGEIVLEQPEIAVEASDLEAYENFLKTYQAKIIALSLEDDAENKIDGLNIALEDSKNALYTKMKENLKQTAQALLDVKNYLDPDSFSEAEMEEVNNMIEFASLYKSIPAENIMQSLSELDDTFIKDLGEFLKSKGKTPGTILDIKDRIILYNHNITNVIEKNKKAEEERKKALEEKKEVKETDTATSDSRFKNAIRAIATWTTAAEAKDSNRTAIRSLMNTMGISNADNLVAYSNNFLDILRDIIIDASEKVESASKMDLLLDEAFDNLSKKVSSDNNDTGLDIILLNNLESVLHLLKAYYNRKAGNFKTFNNIEPPSDSRPPDKHTTNGDPTPPKTKYPLELIRWAWTKPEGERGTIASLLADANIDNFFRNYTVDASTKVVFISANKWVKGWKEGEKAYKGVEQELVDKSKAKNNEDIAYNELEAIPILAAIKLKEYRPGCILVRENGEILYYLIIGSLPSANNKSIIGLSEVQKNIQSIRSDAIRLKPSHDEPYLITENITKDGLSEEVLLSTTMDQPRADSNEIDLSSEPLPILLPSNNIITADMFYVTLKEGRKIVKTNRTPSSNKADINKANWAEIHVEEISLTKNKDGKNFTEVETEDEIINFNSRTKGFADTLKSILELIKGNPSNLLSIISHLNITSSEAAAEGRNDYLNSKIGDTSNLVALQLYISLANDYNFIIAAKDGEIRFGIAKGGKNERKTPVKLWIISSENPNLEVTTIGQLIKELSLLTYETSIGEASIAKWQVSWGNFDLTNLKGADLKLVYIKQAILDKVINAYDVTPHYQPVIDLVFHLADRDKQALENEEIRKRAELQAAQALLNNSIDPATGEPNAGITIDDLYNLVATFSDTIRDTYLKMLDLITSIKNLVESKYPRNTLKLNQRRQSNSTTSTTALANLEADNTNVKPTKTLIVTGICGTVVDNAVRRFFNPNIKDKNKLKELFKEEAKEVFSSITIDYLWEALEDLNKSFIQNHLRVISSGVYTIDREMNNKQVGELDILAFDEIHLKPVVIDIKTYSTDSFELVSSTHNYPVLLSMYAYDLSENTGVLIPTDNMLIYALKLGTNTGPNLLDMYNVTTDDNGVSTINRKKSNYSTVLIAKGARFLMFEVPYTGDAEVELRVNIRREKYSKDNLNKSKGEEASKEATKATPEGNKETPNLDADAMRIEEEVKEKQKKEGKLESVLQGNSELPNLDLSSLPPELLLQILELIKSNISLGLSVNDILGTPSTEKTNDNSCRT